MDYCRAPFSRATNFTNRAKKGVRGKYFHETTLPALFTIHVNLHLMEFPLIFDKIISWKSQKSTKSMKFMALKERAPYGITV